MTFCSQGCLEASWAHENGRYPGRTQMVFGTILVAAFDAGGSMLRGLNEDLRYVSGSALSFVPLKLMVLILPILFVVFQVTLVRGS